MKNVIKIKSLVLSQIFILSISAIIFHNAGQDIFPQSSTEKIAIFEQVWSIVDKQYYDKNFHGVNWKVVYKRYRPLIKKTETDEEFYNLLNKMAGELRDSHTRIFSPPARENRRNHKSVGVGISIGKIDNSFVVTNVLSDSEAEHSGIKAGMIVRKINDLSAKETFSKAQKEVGASSSGRAETLRSFTKMLSGEPDSVLKLELTNLRGENFEVELTRQSTPKNSQYIEKVLPTGLVYIKFDEFGENTAKQVEKTLHENKTAKGLILDLRGNSGGDGETGLQIAGYFLERKVLIARLLTRTGKPPLQEIPMEMYAGGDILFTKPLVILTDEKTASVSELISDALQSYERAYVIGTQTCGCVLGFINYKELKGGGDMSLSEFGFITAKGHKLEGTGVIPDEIAKPTIKDLQQQRDLGLIKAEIYLNNLKK